MVYLMVFVGAGMGGVFRQMVSTAATRLLGLGFPFGTLTVNVVGSVAMGALAALFASRTGLPQELKPLLTTGLLGGFTTFSTFSLDAATLWQRGQTGEAAAYVGSSLALALAGIALGMTLVRLMQHSALA